MTAIVTAAEREQAGDLALTAELPLKAASATTAPASVSVAAKAPPVPLPHVAITANTPGVNTADFVKNDRINIKDGSLFIDGYLVLHPHELAPENETKLRQKMALTYSVNNPSFYEDKDRLAVALNLAQILPVSLDAVHSKLLEQVKKYNEQVDSGADAALQKLLNDKQHPFAAIVRDTIEKPAKDPVGVDTLKNGVGIYLLMREKLTSLGYRNPLVSYVTHARTPDQVLSDLGEKIGVSPIAVRDAALKGGMDGVGKLLGLDPAYVADVKQLTEKAASAEFSLNMIEHWHLGRQLLKGQPSTFEQKIATGMEARITQKIAESRARVHNYYDVPEPIKKEENRIAEALNLVEPIQRALMFKLGYEICYTPEVTADNIAFYPGIYGLHRKAANDLRDTTGTYHIYFSGRGDLKGSMRTLVHEIAHNLWPEQFTPEAVKRIDMLADSDEKRFAQFNKLIDEKFPEFEKFVKAYNAGTTEQKVAVAVEASNYFKDYGVTVDARLLSQLKDAHDFMYLVKHAYDTLSVEGGRYAKSGYDSPHERFREVISRYAELRQVEYQSQPQLLNFLAPGLNEIWQQHYIPHLQRVYDGLAQVAPSKNTIAAQMRSDTEGLMPIGPNGLEAPKVAERPTETVIDPKVDQRPTEPVPPISTLPQPPAPPAPPITPPAPKPAVGDACMADGVRPVSTVATDTIALNPQTLAALGTLDAMNIQAR